MLGARRSAARRQAGRAAAGADRDRARARAAGTSPSISPAPTSASRCSTASRTRCRSTRSRPAGSGSARPPRDALGAQRQRVRTEPGHAAAARARRARCAYRPCSAPKPRAPCPSALVAVMPLARLQALAGLAGQITRILVQQRSRGSRRPHAARELRALAARAAHRRARRTGRHAAARRRCARATSRASCSPPSERCSGSCSRSTRCCSPCPSAARRSPTCASRAPGARRSSRSCSSKPCAWASSRPLVGLAVGYGLSVGVFHQPTGYLAEAFTLSSGTVVGGRAAAARRRCGGLAATCLASAVPLLDLRRGRARDAVYRDDGRARQRARPGGAASAVRRRGRASSRPQACCSR